MISALLAFFTAIPGIGTAITKVTAAVYDAKVRLLMARTGATRDVAVQMLQSAVQEQQVNVNRLQVIASNRVLLWMLVAGAAPIFMYEFQCVVIDTIIYERWLHIHVVTPPIKGQVAEWMNTIIWCLFGSSTVLGVGHLAISAVERAKAS